jgi:pimeloyl-ACP methyl ester carboxylesterase
VAIDRSERVAGLILEASPTTLRNDAGFEHFVESVVSGLEDPIDADFARSFVVGTSSDTLSADMVDRLVDEVLKVPAGVWREMFAELLHYDDQVELTNISTPTLLIWGDADTLVPHDMQDRLRASIAASELLVYAGVGHTPRWEDPARFASDVAVFVERALPTPR